MKKNLANYYILAIIFFLGFILRIFHLDQIPAILNRDEAGLGYNAYLLKETGKDEWGLKWPLALRSFGDYKLIGYPIFVIGSYFIFGVNDFAVRLPSALAGSILIIIAYLFAKKTHLSKNQGLLFALSIAVTPVFFFYSRIGFEANLALTLFATIILLAFHKKPTVLMDIFIAIILLISLFTYNSPLILAPFIIALFVLKRGILKPKKWVILIGLLLIVWIFAIIKLLPLSAQKSGITIFNDETYWAKYIDFRNSNSGILQKITANKYVFYSIIISKNYLTSFSSNFLVFKGGIHPWHALPSYGHIYLITYLFGIVGILQAFFNASKTYSKKRRLNFDRLYLLALLFIALLPSVVTVDSPHATRSLLFFYLFNYFSILNFSFFKNKIKRILVIIFLAFIAIESFLYFKKYFTFYPQNHPDSLQVGFAEFINDMNAKFSNQKIAVVDYDGFQYILTAWYLKIPPQVYFSSISRQQPNSIGFNYGEKVLNYHFIVDKNDRNKEEKVLLEYNKNWKYTEF